MFSFIIYCHRTPTMRSKNWMHLHYHVMKNGRELVQSENPLSLTGGVLINVDRSLIDVDLSPTITILGATLWSHLNPADLNFLHLKLLVADLKRIKGFDTDRFTELHKTGLSWLSAQRSSRTNSGESRRMSRLVL